MAKAEKFVVDKISISDLIKDEFLNKLKEIDKNIFPVSLVFISERGDGEIKQAFPLLFMHQTNEEVKNKLMHIESPDTKLVESVTKLIEKTKNGK